MEIKKDINSIKLSIIIPVYNEKNTIKEILDRVEKQTYIEKQIIVVNDCSQDGCDKIIKDYKFNSEFLILNHKKNNGKGACIKTAKQYITGDAVIIQDADLEYDPSDYKKLIVPIVQNKINAVYGSRVIGKKRYQSNRFTSLLRIFFNHMLTILSNIINNQKLTDAHTCYKLVRTSTFKKINLKEDDFAFCPEITSKLSNLNEQIIEIPIFYNGRTFQEGKKIKTSDGLKAIYALIKYGILKK